MRISFFVLEPLHLFSLPVSIHIPRENIHNTIHGNLQTNFSPIILQQDDKPVGPLPSHIPTNFGRINNGVHMGQEPSILLPITN